MEQQLAVYKQRFRDAQDELDELRCSVEDQKSQASDNRTRVCIFDKLEMSNFIILSFLVSERSANRRGTKKAN